MTELNAKQLIEDLANDLSNYLSAHNVSDPVFIGIQTGGVWIAKQLQSLLDNKTSIVMILVAPAYNPRLSHPNYHVMLTTSMLYWSMMFCIPGAQYVQH